MTYSEAEREWLTRGREGEVQCPSGLKNRGTQMAVVCLCCQLRAGHPGEHVYVAGQRRWTDSDPMATILPPT